MVQGVAHNNECHRHAAFVFQLDFSCYLCNWLGGMGESNPYVIPVAILQ